MNTGIIMIGLALVMLSVGLLVSPSAAAIPDTAWSPCSGSTVFAEDTLAEPGTGCPGAFLPAAPANGVTAAATPVARP